MAAVHARGATVTAHSGMLPGARVAAQARVDCVEHGFALDADVAAAMAAGGVALVATLAVMESWRTFAATTELPRFASDEGRAAIGERRERAHESVRLAYEAGVLVAAGTDFGGGSLRANQLAWEVQTLVAAGLPPTARWPRRPSTAAGCWASRRPASARGRPGRLRAGARRPAVRPGRAVAGVAHHVVTAEPPGGVRRRGRPPRRRSRRGCPVSGR